MLVFLVECFSVLWASEGQGNESRNILADPFSAPVISKPELPPPPEVKNLGVAVSLPSSPATGHSLPAGLRVVMLKSGGFGWLSAADNNKQLIAVKQGGSVILGGQSYFVQIFNDEILLLAGVKGRVIWRGGLIGAVTASSTPEASAVSFTPPLSAGVNPGLRTNSGGQGSLK